MRGRVYFQADRFQKRKLINPADASQQFEIVIRFVGGDFAVGGNFYGAREKRGARVARIADAFADAGTPGDPGSLECVLQQQRNVETVETQLTGEALDAEKFRGDVPWNQNESSDWPAPDSDKDRQPTGAQGWRFRRQASAGAPPAARGWR